MAQSPLQLLFAESPDGEPSNAKVKAEPFHLKFGDAPRPRLFIEGATEFHALSLGIQDIVELTIELRRISGFYPVQVDVRDRTMQDFDGGEEVEELLLGFLETGSEDQILSFLSGPADGVLIWSVMLSGPTMHGSVIVSRDGTLQLTTPDVEHSVVESVITALRIVLLDEREG